MVPIDYQPAQFAVNWHANVSAIGLAKKQYRQSLR
jgi:hypothetical protein